MARKQRLFHIFKLNTTDIEKAQYNLTLDVGEAKIDGKVISVSDNQTFHAIRRVKGQQANFAKLDKLYEEKVKLKKKNTTQNSIQRIKELEEELEKILFVADVVNVVIEDNKAYKKMCKQGLRVNGIEFVRLCCGAGQARRSTVSFINKELFIKVDEIQKNGLVVDKINISKYNAYYGLYMSGIQQVSEPRVAVVKDCEMDLYNKKLDWVVDKQKPDLNGKIVDCRDIEERIVDGLSANFFDGQGLISPRLSQKWAEELELDWLPASYIIRAPFIKGMVATFDFHRFAKEIAKTDSITDCYGKNLKISEVDIIISCSQFKMWKMYRSWEQYLENFHKYNHIWGVSRYSAKVDNEYSPLNYQYIQTLNLDTDEKIKELAQPTIDWIQKVCDGDKLYTLLFMLGVCDGESSLEDLVGQTDSNVVKAILYNDRLLEDPYVKKKIYRTIEKKIQEAKIGRLMVNGNYSMMIADPYAQAEHIFGLPTKGLLKEFEYYNNFWKKRKVTKVDACRSPLVDFSEHNILNLKVNEKTEEWYQYLYTGTIYNIWGLDCILHSDSDFDGDIVYTTNNQTIIDNVIPDLSPISYDKTVAPFQKLTLNNIIASDIRSFDCKIGQTTNYSTKFISMLPLYKPESREYKELVSRIKQLRRYIGDSIDSAKGIKTKPFPKEWKKRYKVLEEDPIEIKKEKYFYNNLVGKRKPYFFIYIYSGLYAEYRKHRKDYNTLCKERLGCKLGELLGKKDKTHDEKQFVKAYYYCMPVTKTNCIINRLCWIIEGVELKYKRSKNEYFNYQVVEALLSPTAKFNRNRYKEMQELYATYKREYNKIVAEMNITSKKQNESEVSGVNHIDKFYTEMRVKAQEICSNAQELANYAVRICYVDNPKGLKDFAWTITIDGLMKNIRENKSDIIEVPIRDENGVNYLGAKYSLLEVKNDDRNNKIRA